MSLFCGSHAYRLISGVSDSTLDQIRSSRRNQAITHGQGGISDWKDVNVFRNLKAL